MTQFSSFDIASLEGERGLLTKTQGKVVLAVNVASHCGYTPQYAGLEQLHKALADQEFMVIGFPCNQFGQQEPGSPAEIRTFCSTNYAVTFPLSEKIDVNGSGRHPLYAWMPDPEQGFPGDSEWNFEKFLIGRDGRPLARYPAATGADDKTLLAEIAEAL